MKKRQFNEVLNEFENEVYIMLVAFDCTRDVASYIISDNRNALSNWISETANVPIVTAAVAARILLRKYERQV